MAFLAVMKKTLVSVRLCVCVCNCGMLLYLVPNMPCWVPRNTRDSSFDSSLRTEAGQ